MRRSTPPSSTPPPACSCRPLCAPFARAAAWCAPVSYERHPELSVRPALAGTAVDLRGQSLRQDGLDFLWIDPQVGVHTDTAAFPLDQANEVEPGTDYPSVQPLKTRRSDPHPSAPEASARGHMAWSFPSSWSPRLQTGTRRARVRPVRPPARRSRARCRP